MNYFYVTDNTGKCEPELLEAVDYIHVKARTDGDSTIIITEQELPEDDGLTLLSQEDAQSLLNEWIDSENEDPPKNVDGVDMLQAYISLESFL